MLAFRRLIIPERGVARVTWSILIGSRGRIIFCYCKTSHHHIFKIGKSRCLSGCLVRLSESAAQFANVMNRQTYAYVVIMQCIQCRIYKCGNHGLHSLHLSLSAVWRWCPSSVVVCVPAKYYYTNFNEFCSIVNNSACYPTRFGEVFLHLQLRILL